MIGRKIALITGATGFIGSNLAVQLLKEGWQVHAVIRTSSNLIRLKERSENRIIFHVHDKENTLNQILKTVNPDIVFHLASFVLVQHKYEDISALIDSNIKFGTQLLDAMINNNIYNLINTGTYWQNYQNESYSPVNLYAASKEAFEKILQYYQETSPIKVITLKLFDTYGSDDPRPKLFSLLDKAAKSGEKLAMSKGEQLIDIVYIDDVIKAYLISAQYLLEGKSEHCGTYAVTSEKPIRLVDLVKVYEQTTGKKVDIAWGARPYRMREVMIPWNTGEKIYGWKAEVDLKAGINKLIKCNKIPTGGAK